MTHATFEEAYVAAPVPNRVAGTMFLAVQPVLLTAVVEGPDAAQDVLMMLAFSLAADIARQLYGIDHPTEPETEETQAVSDDELADLLKPEET